MPMPECDCHRGNDHTEDCATRTYWGSKEFFKDGGMVDAVDTEFGKQWIFHFGDEKWLT